MLENILQFLFYFFIALVVNALVGMYYYRRQEKFEEIENNLIDNTVKFEKVIDGDRTLWMVYNYRDNLFLAQGSTEDEATENLKKRFPGRDFWKLHK